MLFVELKGALVLLRPVSLFKWIFLLFLELKYFQLEIVHRIYCLGIAAQVCERVLQRN